MPTSTLAKRGWTILFLAIAAFYLYGLGAFPLVGPDEPRYAQIAREMLERRDFITPTLGGVPWFEKPALLYWMMMASYRLLGVNEYSARLAPALCGLVTAAFIWWLAKSVEKSVGNGASSEVDGQQTPGRGSATWSALVFLSSAGAIGFSRAASFDIVLTMTVTGALSCFFVWNIRTGGSNSETTNNTAPFAGFYFFVGLSLLAKGFAGLIIPLGVASAYFLVRREWPSRRLLKSVIWGLPIVLVVAGSWYGPMIYRHGWLFIDQFIIQHHFARFATNKYHHPQPVYFYLPILALFTLPWTVVLVAGFVSARRWQWRGSTALDRLRVFGLVWIAMPLVFFSLSGSKLPGYLLPVLPAASLLVGERISCFLKMNRGDKVIRLTSALLIIGVAAASWYSVRSLGVSGSWVIAASVVALLVAAIGLLIPAQRTVSFLLFAVMPFLIGAMALRPAATVAGRDSVRDMISTADARGFNSAPVFYFLTDDRTAEFYAGGRLAYQPNGEPFRFDGAQQLAAAVREKGGAALVIMETRWERQLTDYSVVRAEKIATNGWLTIFRVRVERAGYQADRGGVPHVAF